MPTIYCRDIDLYYEITGKGNPLLFIHGLGSSHRDWEPQVEFFSRHYRVITYDVRGHGRSTKPPGPYSVSQFAQDTAELIRSLGIAPAHVVGLSMGGMIAFQLAIDEPGLVKSLVIANSGPELIIRTFQHRLEFWRRRLVVRLFGASKFAEIMGTRLLPSPEHEALRQALVARWADNDTRAYLDALRAIVGWSVAERIGTIRCPTLVMAADQDYTPVSIKAAYAAQIPQAELVVIPDSRHLTPLERPGAFNAALLAFLERQDHTGTYPAAHENSRRRKLTLRQMIGSILAAGLGVQSEKNRERDFEHGSPTAFVLLALAATILFVLTLVLIVKMVLKAAGT